MIRPIPSRPGYFAGSDGRIYSRRGSQSIRCLTETPNRQGYPRVRLSRGTRQSSQWASVAPLVAEAFHGPRPFPGAHVRHLDGVKTNNLPSNLAYGTAKENEADKARHGLTVRGIRHHLARHTDEEVAEAIARVAGGETQTSVASDLGVTQQAISYWCRGAWRTQNRAAA
jgi:hypothetical protein